MIAKRIRYHTSLGFRRQHPPTAPYILGTMRPSKRTFVAACLGSVSTQRLRCELSVYDILMQRIVVAFGWRISIVDQVLALL